MFRRKIKRSMWMQGVIDAESGGYENDEQTIKNRYNSNFSEYLLGRSECLVLLYQRKFKEEINAN